MRDRGSRSTVATEDKIQWAGRTGTLESSVYSQHTIVSKKKMQLLITLTKVLSFSVTLSNI